MTGKPFANGDSEQGSNRGYGADIGSASVGVPFVTGGVRRIRVATVKTKRARCRNEKGKMTEDLMF